jgi:hypothetical protein
MHMFDPHPLTSRTLLVLHLASKSSRQARQAWHTLRDLAATPAVTSRVASRHLTSRLYRGG